MSLPKELQALSEKAEQQLISKQFDLAEQDYLTLCQKYHEPRVFYKGLAFVKAAKGNVVDAIPLLQSYLELNEKDAEAWHNLAVLNEKNQHLPQAENCFQKAISLGHDSAQDYLELLNSQHQQHKYLEQLPIIIDARQKHPDNTRLKKIENVLRVRLHEQDFESASSSDVINTFTFIDAWFKDDEINAVSALIRTTEKLFKKLDSIDWLIKHFKDIIKIEGASFSRFLLLGVCYHHQQNNELAINYYAAAKRMNPNSVVTIANLGIVLRRNMRYEEAEKELLLAQSLSQNISSVVENLAITSSQLGKMDRAIELYLKTIELMPDSHKAKFSLGIVYLLNGQFKAGWEYYFHRSRELKYYKMEEKVPRWQGQDLSDKHILIMNEQGYGDTINFIRYIPLLATRCKKVSVYVQKLLLPLSRHLIVFPENCKLVEMNAKIKDVDYFAPLLDLASQLDSNLANIPYPDGYFSIPPEKQQFWQKQLKALTGPKVGLVWRGSKAHNRDKERSLDLEKLAPIFLSANCHFISLQVGNGEEELLCYRDVIQDYSSHIRDFSDTAALVQQLDLLITVDTSTAHLGGALGIPTWTLVNFIPDWRWLMQGTDTHWYNSMTLYREKERFNWDSVLPDLFANFKQWLATMATK
ncbi:MAG: hypothetical protein ACFHVJ_17970 [Aestuariibacter sp.]